MPASGKPLGVLGGTFDPVHNAHLRLAEEALDSLGLAEVCWIPAGQPAHRAAPTASVAHRLAMVRLAVDGHPRFHVDDTEARSPAPSYSVPTLRRLREQIGAQRPLVLLLGADAFRELASWHRWRELFELAHIAVATRPHFSLDEASFDPPLAAEFRSRASQSTEALANTRAGRIVPFRIADLDISATALRSRIAAGDSVRHLLPDPVLDYIAAHRLYLN